MGGNGISKSDLWGIEVDKISVVNGQLGSNGGELIWVRKRMDWFEERVKYTETRLSRNFAFTRKSKVSFGGIDFSGGVTFFG